MKLLVFTQAIDVNDPTLSVYFDWVKEISLNFESTIVITLKKDKDTSVDSLRNTKVLSLGKEDGESRLKYIKNLYKYIWSEKDNYDSVFVHMNQEYVLLGAMVWKILGKKVYMWRNHHAGSILTDIAALFCEKVFCTSKFSYTAKYKKTVLMPVGVGVDKFKNNGWLSRKPSSVLFLARIAPSKRPDTLLSALKVLKNKNFNFQAWFYGDSLPKDRAYHEDLKSKNIEYGISNQTFFKNGVPNIDTVRIYNEHEVSVNTSSSGMYDKTIFEAMSCGTLILASNKNLLGLIDPIFIFQEGDIVDLAKKLSHLLSLSLKEKERRGNELREVVIKHHSLSALGEKLAKEIS